MYEFLFYVQNRLESIEIFDDDDAKGENFPFLSVIFRSEIFFLTLTNSSSNEILFV